MFGLVCAIGLAVLNSYAVIKNAETNKFITNCFALLVIIVYTKVLVCHILYQKDFQFLFKGK